MLLEKKIPIRYILGKIKKDIVIVLFISVLFYALKVFFLAYLPVIPLPMVAILGTSISLILAFRINQSYDRWWEARKVWGAIVNDSRTLIMQLSGFIPDRALKGDAVAKMYTNCAYRQIGWCYCLSQALRGTAPLAGLENYLPAEEIDYAGGHVNKSNALLMLHTRDVKEMHRSGIINDVQQIQLDNTLMRLCDSMGKCERINNTVFPRTYSLIVHFFIYMFVVILSLGLVESVGLYEIPILTVIASAFFLIEKTGIHMQDPFRGRPTDTPMTAIARTIEINIRQLLGEKNVPPPITTNDFYLL